MKKFDLIIIGGGAAAFAAAIRANELQAKTVMVNAGLPLGGTCVNVGCVPSKALKYAAEVLHSAKHHGLAGLDLKIENFSFQKTIQEEIDLVKTFRKEKYEKVLKNLQNVKLIKGRAKFISAKAVEVRGEKLTAKKFIIAAGSTANVPPIDGIRKVGFLTHIEALKIKRLPKELIVVGAGPVGLELAQIYARFGSKVTILQRGPRIFPPAEEIITNRLSEIFSQEGITIKTKVEIINVRRERGKKVVNCKVNGRQEKISGAEILLAAGKTPNTAYLDLDKAGVKINNRKAAVVNKFFQTSAKHIFAVGDVAGLPLRLETTAGKEGTLSAENALKGSRKSIDYSFVPYAVFTDPELASVGLTDAEAVRRGIKCSCRNISFTAVPKAHILRRTEGVIKMVADARTQRILGVHILAPGAGNLIAEAMILVKYKITISQALEFLPIFPTMSEAIKLVARSFTKDISKLSCCI